MNKVTFVLNNGKERLIKERLANHLQRCGKGFVKSGSYLTRDMQAAPVLTPTDAEKAPPATDAAKALADKKGVDIASIEGSGRDGAVTVGDVKKAAKKAD